MLLSYVELRRLVEEGKLLQNVESLDQINSASIDITLGDYIMVERSVHGVVDLKAREPLNMEKRLVPEDGYRLAPGEFILAESREVFNLPCYISAEYKLKSSMARIGINHCLAGWCDAGWHGSVLTLELKSYSS